MKNVLLISLDTLRADVAYSGRFPCLDSLRQESAVFTDVTSSAPLTPPSHGSILTGQQPYTHGIRHLFRESLSPHAPTLAELLKASGRRTGAIVSCPGMNKFYGLGRGFDHYDDEIPPLADGRNPLHVVDVKLRGTALKRADEVMRRSLAWLDANGDAPFFLFVHTFDAHWPYEPPEAPPVAVPNAYEAEVAYCDGKLAQLFAYLRERGLLGQTLVVCLSDHGEDLGGWYANDHAGERGHPEEEGHGALLYEATQRVPLFIRRPGHAAATIDAPVRLVDVAPTILDLLGLSRPPMEGESLVPLLAGEPADAAGPNVSYFETFFREELAQNAPPYAHFRAMKGVRIDGRYKVLWEHDGDRVEVFDLKRDPLEAAPRVLEPVVLDTAPRVLHADVLHDLPRPGLPAAAWPLLERLAKAMLALGDCQLILDGSLARGTGDAHADIDLRFVCDTPAARSQTRIAVRELLGREGRMLAQFAATHMGLPQLDVHFLEVDGRVVKLDLHYLVAGPAGAAPGGVTLVGAADARPPARPAAPDAPAAHDFTDLHQRFAGWLWVAHGRIERGELWDADDCLNAMRTQALLPLVLHSRGQPSWGCRELERRLTKSDLERLAATRPVMLDVASLRTALGAMADLFESVLGTVAAKLGREFRVADLSRLRALARV
ncbi:MAG: sulfatase [Burkholderiales bacterium]|jgi:arylsulfatase|nr:sulfatase [Burkholderiales bacterium]